MILPNPRYTVKEPETIKRSHWYPVIDQEKEYKFRGVTTFLSIVAKPQLISWAKREALEAARHEFHKMWGKAGIWDDLIDDAITRASEKPKEVSDKAMDIGARAHDWIDEYIKRTVSKIPTILLFEKLKGNDIEPCIRSFLNWVKTNKVQFIASEIPVAYIGEEYATKVDALGLENGEYVIYEHKTSKGIYSDYLLQVGATAEALKETYGIVPQYGRILRYGKDGSFEQHKVLDLEEKFAWFCSAKDLYHGIKEAERELKQIKETCSKP